MTNTERRLIRLYSNASYANTVAGHNWYLYNHQCAERIATQYAISLQSTCGVIAALSPGLNWDLNLDHAKQLIDAWSHHAPIPRVGVYGGRNRDKSMRILRGECPHNVLGGPKTRAFYACLINPTEPSYVCIDRHAFAAAYGRPLTESELNNRTLTGHVAYRVVSAAYIRSAQWLRVLPNRLQATIWLQWRASL